MTENTFKPVGKSDNRLYGPRKILAYGLSPDTRQTLASALAGSEAFRDVPMVCPQKSDTGLTLEELFTLEDQATPDGSSLVSPFMIMAGLLEHELHAFMDMYRALSLPRPIWATLTPTSATWTLEDLLAELTREHQAMQNSVPS
ncbi:DUF3783 domain-containing protein [Desulfoplanes sp.]